MEMPVICDDCDDVIELNDSRACRECGQRQGGRCRTCHEEHTQDVHAAREKED
jgi:predicted RNA-binding Zn-ribbon protein involved in translation (DUF1610 family)